MGMIGKRLSREAGDLPSLEVFKAQLNTVQSKPLQLTVLWSGDLNKVSRTASQALPLCEIVAHGKLKGITSMRWYL